jgi:hypothetical protein
MIKRKKVKIYKGKFELSKNDLKEGIIYRTPQGGIYKKSNGVILRKHFTDWLPVPGQKHNKTKFQKYDVDSSKKPETYLFYEGPFN